MLIVAAIIAGFVGLIMALGADDSSSYSSLRYSEPADDGLDTGWWWFIGGFGSIGALVPALLMSMIGNQVWQLRAEARERRS
ncbi:hypothetical protein [Corynebacterium nuruki]|uniref:hypothetical protein n=1 Tax=Corynebacterium nuruki TaxID=1032851 RepID=UPI0039BF4883